MLGLFNLNGPILSIDVRLQVPGGSEQYVLSIRPDHSTFGKPLPGGRPMPQELMVVWTGINHIQHAIEAFNKTFPKIPNSRRFGAQK